MATTIKLKNGSGAPLAGDLVQGEPALDLTNKRLYTEDSGGTVIEVGTNPSTIDINAGTIDGTVIGGSSAAAGTFTTFTSTGIDDNATSTAITIDSSENVGIGTASPSNLLEVRGSSSGQNVLHLSNSAGASDGAAENQVRVTCNGNNNWGNLDIQSYTTIFTQNGSEAMRIDSSGNVGIGTASPANTLHVETSGNTGIQLRSGTASYGNINFNDGASAKGQILYDHNGDYMRLYVNGSERMRIDASGNLLVGMTSASTSNDGAGIRANGLIHGKRADTVAVFNRKTSDGNIVEFEKDNTTVGSIGANSGYMYLGSGDTGLYFNSVTNQVYPVSATGGGANEDGTQDLGRTTARFKDLYFSGTLTNNGTGGINIDTSGNVGIGATSLSRKLVVYDSTYPVIALQNSGSGTTLTDGFQMQYDGTAYLWNYENSAMLFGTNSAERMRIQTDGQVLIGTSSILSGGIDGLHLNTVGGDTGITFGYSGTTIGWLYYIVGAAMQLQTPTGTTIRMVSDSNGVQLTNGATSWSALSDERKKDIIEPITNAAEKVSTLRTVIGKYKEEDEGTRRAFLIAQDVQKVLPEAVGENDDGDLLLQYTETIPLLVAAIKEQQAQITELKAEVAALKGA